MKNVELRLRYTHKLDFIACLYSENAPRENGVHTVHDTREYQQIANEVMNGTTFKREIFITVSRASAEELALRRRKDIMDQSGNSCEITIEKIADDIHATGILTNNPEYGDHVLPFIADLRKQGPDLTLVMRDLFGPVTIPRTDYPLFFKAGPSTISREGTDNPLTLVEDDNWAESVTFSRNIPFLEKYRESDTTNHVLDAISHLVLRCKNRGVSASEDMIAEEICKNPTVVQEIFITDYVIAIAKNPEYEFSRFNLIKNMIKETDFTNNSFLQCGDKLNTTAQVMNAIDRIATGYLENSVDMGNGLIDIEVLSHRIHQTPTRDEFYMVYDDINRFLNPETVLWGGISIQEINDQISISSSPAPVMDII